MKRVLIFTGVICLALMLLPACAPQTEQPAEPVAGPDTEADAEAIKDLFQQQYADTATAGDLEGYLALFVDDCIVLPSSAAILTKKDTWRNLVQSSYLDPFDVELIVTVQETKVAGDWSFARGTYKQRLTPKDGGQMIEEVGKYISILTRQSDGTWKISRHIWNTDNPPPGEPTT
jgi:uncharacterized protein (TIGR02246 family)